MIDELRQTLDRKAAGVAPKPDPYRRLMARRARRRTIVAAVVTTLVLSSAVPVTMLLRQSDRTAGAPPAELAPMLGSRTRGTLAGDTGFLAAIRERAAGEVDRELVGGPRDLYLPADPEAIKVLFAGDLGPARIVVLAGKTSRPLRATYFGPKGEAPQGLWLAEWGPLELVARPAWGEPGQRHQLIFGPEGSSLEIGAQTRYLRDGPRTQWRALDTDVHLATSATTSPGTRMRVTTGGQLLTELTVSAVAEVDPQQVAVDETSLSGQPEGVRAAAREAAYAVAHRTGLTTATARFVLLWGGQIEMKGLAGMAGRTASAATVLALTPDGGGPFATVALDPADRGRGPITHPTGEGAIGDPATSVIALRLEESDRMLIIAPPSATFVKILEAGNQRERVPLERGIGHTTWSGKAVIIVRACADDGAVIAETAFGEAS